MIRRAVRQLKAYVPGEQPRGRRVVKLNTNENPYPPSPAVLRVLRSMDPDTLRRYPDPVCRSLRARIARLHRVTEEQVLVGNGSDEVLALCARAFVERTGVIGWFEPSYSLYPVLAGIEDIRTKPVPLPPDFAWRMPARYTADLFFLTQPNAPVSRLFDPAMVEAFARRFKGVLLIDEAYADFAHTDCIHLARSLSNVVVARSLSKSYSLAGLRVGYAVGPARLIAALYTIKDSYNVGAIPQAMAEAAIADQAWMRRNVERVVETRERVALALRARGWQVHTSSTNFIWARPPAGQRASGIFEALRRKHIFVRYFPGPRTGDYLRITIGKPAEMAVFLDAVATIR